MKEPGIYHLLAFIYIAFANESNGTLAEAEEREIKTIIARWMNVNYRNINEYESVMSYSLNWFNSIDEKKRKNELIKVMTKLANTDGVDLEMKKQILSEIRDISVSDGKYDKYERNFHDRLALTFGFDIDSSYNDTKPRIGFKVDKNKKD